MARVAIDINGRRYDIACDDGQEARLQELGSYLDRRVRELASTVGPVGETRLLVMAGLLIADELHEAGGRARAAPGEGEGEEEGDEAAAGALESVAERLEHIAARLEGA